MKNGKMQERIGEEHDDDGSETARPRCRARSRHDDEPPHRRFPTLAAQPDDRVNVVRRPRGLDGYPPGAHRRPRVGFRPAAHQDCAHHRPVRRLPERPPKPHARATPYFQRPSASIVWIEYKQLLLLTTAPSGMDKHLRSQAVWSIPSARASACAWSAVDGERNLRAPAAPGGSWAQPSAFRRSGWRGETGLASARRHARSSGWRRRGRRCRLQLCSGRSMHGAQMLATGQWHRERYDC